MTDMFDRAQEREAELRADALADQQRRAVLPRKVSAARCDCGEPIPEARRKALPGVTTCVSCQRDIERRARRDWGSH